MNRLYENESKMFCDAIRTMANKPDNIDNLESYLSHHFEIWLKKFARNAGELATEMKNFAEMEI